MSAHHTALQVALGNIGEALDSRDYPERDLLRQIEALPTHTPLARALILAAGDHCDEWIADEPQRRHGAALDARRAA